MISKSLKNIKKRIGLLQAELNKNLNKFTNNQKISNDDLKRLWEKNDDAIKKIIIDAYEKIPGGLNTNSMTLFSGSSSPYLFIHKIFKHSLFQQRSLLYYDGYFNFKSGCLYTGDYDSRGKLKFKDLKNRYKEQFDNNLIGCIQVPHHGSSNNFNDEFLKLNAFLVISVGYSNKYGHPHGSVIKKILNNMYYPIIVDEHVGTRVYFDIC